MAGHPRCWGQEQALFNPVHYLALLERKPRGFDHARPLERWDLPKGFALQRRRLEAADPLRRPRDFIRALRLLERFSLEQLTRAALDRLTHRFHILETKGGNYRLQDASR